MGSVSRAAPRPQTDLQSILATALPLLSKSLAIFLLWTSLMCTIQREEILENVAQAELCRWGTKPCTILPVTVQRMHVLSPQSPTPKPSIFFVFQINGVSASERRSDRQGKYSCSSVSLGDWFQNPPRVPKSMDAQESCIKRLAQPALSVPRFHIR